MSKRSKKGKFRPNGAASKVKFDILPPQGDAEVSVVGYGALVLVGIMGATILAGASAALAPLAIPLAGVAIALYILRGVVRVTR